MSWRWLVVSVAAMMVAGCAETEFLFNTAKQVRGRDNASPPMARTTPAYKVGNPYQIGGVWYYPAVDYNYDETGIASWYGADFHGKLTANGENYDMNSITAAHRTLPLPSIAEVTNLENGRTIQVRVNDRGPFARGRIIDLSRRSAQLLGFERQGTAKVRVRILAEPSRQLAAQLGGKDESGLMVTDGVRGAPRMAVASAEIPGTPPAPMPSPPKGGSALGASTPVVVTPGSDVRVVPVKPANIYVQAGAYAEYHNAIRVRAALAALGATDISQVRTGKQSMFRVRLGPVKSVSEADRLLERIAASGYPDARVVVD